MGLLEFWLDELGSGVDLRLSPSTSLLRIEEIALLFPYSCGILDGFVEGS